MSSLWAAATGGAEGLEEEEEEELELIGGPLLGAVVMALAGAAYAATGRDDKDEDEDGADIFGLAAGTAVGAGAGAGDADSEPRENVRQDRNVARNKLVIMRKTFFRRCRDRCRLFRIASRGRFFRFLLFFLVAFAGEALGHGVGVVSRGY